MVRKALIFSQDVGGAKFLSPVIKNLIKMGPCDFEVIAHPLSEDAFDSMGIPYHRLADAVGPPPIKEASWADFTQEKMISHILCTTSSTYRDLSNSNLIRCANAMEIPCLGVMDHWKGFDRFFDGSGSASYLPEFIGCIDEFCKKRLLELYKTSDRIFVIGHPFLEMVKRRFKKNRKRKKGIINIALASQPDTRDSEFTSIFLKKIGERSLADVIAESVKSLKSECSINLWYQPHPKEKRMEVFPGAIRIFSGVDILADNDIFIGFDSMLLVEAFLSGGFSVSLRLPEISNLSDAAIPYNYSAVVDDSEDLTAVLDESVKKIFRNERFNDRSIFPIDNSIGRATAAFKDFFNKEKVHYEK